MATNYSLVCWGGLSGKAVTMTIANPCVVSSTNHGLRDGTGLVFTTSGALPTGVTSGTTYYARRTGLADPTNTFNLYDTSAHAIAGGTTGRVTTTGSQSGTHTCKSAYRYALSDLTRWGSTRIFDSLNAWNTHRTTTVPTTLFDDEICEIADAFTDTATTFLTISMTANTCLITTLVNGARSNGFHNGVVGAGYVVNAGFNLNWFNVSLDGFTVTPASGTAVEFSQPGCGIYRIIINNHSNHAVAFSTGQTYAVSCLAYGGTGDGFYVRQYVNAYIFNCIAAKQATYGFQITSNPTNGFYYNNISIGNATANWGTKPNGLYSGSGNAGLSGDSTVWNTTGVPIVVMATTDFLDYTNNDFHPATITSPQVETGTLYPGDFAWDIADDVRPSYAGALQGTTVTAGGFVTGLSYTIVSVGSTSFTSIGASANTVGVTFKATGAGSGTGTATLNAKYDIGPYEFDLGYGLSPVVRTLDLSGVITGSQVVVYTSGTQTELTRNNSTSGTTFTWDAAASITVDYTVMKLGYDPIRITGVSLSTTSTAQIVQQKSNRAWVASSGLTYSSDLLYTVGTPNTLKLRIASTLQNAMCCLYEAFINTASNTALKNVAFPVASFGDASFTLLNGCEWRGWATAGSGHSNTSIPLLSRDGLRYSSDDGTTTKAQWAAILTLDTPAGMQVKYRQTTGGSIVNAQNTGAMDQLVQVYGDASYGGPFDYRDHMVLKAPNPGYSQPKPDLVATYGNLADGFYVASLAPALQYATTNADLDAAHLALNNGTLTYTISASHTLAEIYQRAQWWANQDAQWDATIPLTTIDGATFTTAYSITVATGSVLSAGNIAMGAKTITTEFAGAKAYSYTGGTWGQATTIPSFSGGTLTLPTTLTTSPGFSMSSAAITFTGTATPTLWDLSTCTFSGAITLTNTSGAAITVAMPSLVGYSVVNTGVGAASITLTYPSVTRGLAFSDLVAGSQVKVFDTGTQTEAFTTSSSGTSETWSEGVAGSRTVDYTVMKAGYLPIRVTGVVVTGALTGGILSVPIAQISDRTWVASTGLTYTTNCTINAGTKIVTWSIATTVQNLYSFLIESWISQASLKNTAFPFSSNGPNSITFGQGWESRGFSTAGSGYNNTSLLLLSRDGLRYTDINGVRTAAWCAILTSGVPAGSQVRYQQSDGGTTVNAAITGDMDQLVQIYGDASHGSFDRTGYLVLKVQREGYDQAEGNVYSLYSTLDDQLYVVGLAPTPNGVATGNPSLTTAPTISVGTYSYAGKTYGIKIVDGATPNTGTNILRWLRYNFALGGAFQGRDGFGWHDLVRVNGSKFKTVQGSVYGGAATKGVIVYMNDGVTAHPDFDTFTADDGSVYTMPLYQSVIVNGITTTSRVQIYDTTHSTQLYNAVPGTTSFTWTDPTAVSSSRTIRVRIADVVTTTAKQFIEANIGTCGTTIADKDVRYTAAQVNDAVYNANAINGPSVYGSSGITFSDATPDIVNCNIGGGSVSWPTIYACFVYWNSTVGGIANDFTYIAAPDTANYLLSGMKIRNTSATDLMIISGYGRDATTNASKDIIDTAGSTGNIFMAPDHVTPYAVSGTYAITGDAATILAAIPSAAAVRSEIDANSTKLDVAVSTRLATAGYTAPSNATIASIYSVVDTEVAAIKAKTDNLPASPAAAGEYTSSIAAIQADTDALQTALASIPTPPSAAAIRTEIDANSTKLDVAISTRLAGSSYVAPDNATITSIQADTDALQVAVASLPTASSIRSEIDANSTKLDVAVSTRLATAGYTAPDNTSISAIKTKTDNLPADPASGTQVNTRLASVSYSAPPSGSTVATAVRAELAAELAHIDADITSRQPSGISDVNLVKINNKTVTGDGNATKFGVLP